MSRLFRLAMVALFAVLVTGWNASMNSAAQNKGNPDVKAIPKNVMDALKTKFPKAKIRKWTNEKEGDVFIYDIEFTQGKQKFEADIKTDGKIHNWERQIKAKDLPKAVKKAVRQKYAKAKLKEIMAVTEVKNGKDILEGYEIVLETADKKGVELMVAPDGKILEIEGLE